MSSAYEQLVGQLSNPAAKSKVAAKFGGYIRDRLREASFAEKIIPSERVDKSQCQVSTKHDSLVKMVSLEPKSRAMVVTFRGESRARFIRGNRVEVPFITVMSDMFQKPEQEFLAYDFPIGKVINDNSVKDIQEVQDREFLIHAEAGIQALQAEANGGSPTALNTTSIAGGAVQASVVKGELALAAGGDNARVMPLQRGDIVSLIKLLDGNRLESDLLLMTSVDWDDILQWTSEDNGAKLQSETAVQGWTYNTLLGKRYIRSVKTDILRPGNVYAFTAADFLGRFYVLNNTKFYIDKVINMIKFVAWKDIGMSIVNISAVRKLELYSGDASSVDDDSILGSVAPMAEEDLGAENNRAGDRKFYPQVVQF